MIAALLTLSQAANGQKASPTRTIAPVAFDRYYFMGDPKNAIQRFIGEIRKPDGIELVKIVYLPKSDGLRGTKVDFINVKSLGSSSLWSAVLHEPQEADAYNCRFINYFGKMLRFRLTSLPADVKFDNLDEMPCFLMREYDDLSKRENQETSG